jgi:hypothetical protein
MPVGTIVPAVADVLHSTLTKSRRKLVMASIKSNALMAWVFANDRVEYEDGGYNITNPLTIGRNPNVTSYRYYAPLPVNQTDEFETVEYGYSRVAGSVIISDQEQDENNGSAAIFKLMKEKMNVLEESIKDKFSQYLYAAGGGTDPQGLLTLIPTNPTTGTLGGINRGTITQWRTSAYIFAGGVDSTNIEEVFDDILMDLTLKGDRPTVILTGRNIYRIYRQAVRDKFTIPLSEGKAGKRMFDLGFEGCMHNGIPMMYDEDCPVNFAYFINDTYLRLHMLRGVNMKVKELVAPWNVDAVGSRVVWQGQWCLWRAYRTHAVMTN